MQDMAEHKGEELKAAIKEGVGKLTGDKSLEAEGMVEKNVAKVKHTADEIRDDLTDKE
jgi:uncharacterized protein YjbJ (UPF0337 family)